MAVSIEMITKSETILSIRRDADIILAGSKGERLARSIGMDKVQKADAATAISELASNLVKHQAVDGKIIVREVSREGNKGIEVISSDLGPGIADIDKAMTDGYSTSGSLGIGLSAVNRLMDEFKISSNTAEGTLVTTRKWVKPESRYAHLPDFELSVFSRPLPGQKYNGDAYFVKRYKDKIIFAVVDGLGHGQGAKEASEVALDCLENYYKRPFTEIFQLCHKQLKETRGAAMSLCRIDLKDRVMTHTGIGNVQTRIWSSEPTPSPFCMNGTLGITIEAVRVDDYPLPQYCVIIMFSDGVSGHFSPGSLRGFLSLKPQSLARQILDNHAKDNDDATIIVGRLSDDR